jgi:methylphosphotriester-DNA--protein-cysteine methyltransferase
MIRDADHSPAETRHFIRRGSISFAGHVNARIYGTLDCASGKRMKKENRVFFKTEMEAICSNFRPCGHCLQSLYVQWKKRA